MLNTLDWLSALKVKTNIQSDYGLHKLLGVAKATISGYRTGKTHFSDEIAAKVAGYLDVHPSIVLSSIGYERAVHDEEKAVWAYIYESVKGPQYEELMKEYLRFAA